MKNYDLALEAKEVLEKGSEKLTELSGIKAKTVDKDQYKITYVTVLNDTGEKKLGKPKGEYITIEMPKFKEYGQAFYKVVSEELSGIIKKLGVKEAPTVLVIGLGNEKITSDALGPMCIDKLIVSRHLYDLIPDFKSELGKVCALRTGVLGTTGVETLEIVKGVCDRVKPDLIIAIDSLASLSKERLATTIQITNTGIMPGSGIGNNRKEISEKTLNIPVIGIGVPFVIDASKMLSEQNIDLSELKGMFVTPKEIDVLVNRMTDIISAGINLSFHDIELEDIASYIN